MSELLRAAPGQTVAVESIAARVAEALRGRTVEEAVAYLLRRLRPGERALLVDYALRVMVRGAQRKEQLEVERRSWEAEWEAERVERLASKQAEEERKRAREAEQKEQAERERAAFHRDPALWYGTDEYRKAAEARGEPTVYMNNKPSRDAFRRWCKANDKDFDEWFQRASAVARETGPAKEDMCGSDWYSGGVTAYFHKKESERITGLMSDLVADVARTTRLKVTAELLASEFALGDGRKVTWGQATRDDHQQRLTLLEKNAVANVEAAARHRQALDLLEQSGVTRLAELPPGEGEESLPGT